VVTPFLRLRQRLCKHGANARAMSWEEALAASALQMSGQSRFPGLGGMVERLGALLGTAVALLLQVATAV